MERTASENAARSTADRANAAQENAARVNTVQNNTMRANAAQDSAASLIAARENAATNNGSTRCQTGRGYLPSCAPLANPYVPYQLTGEEKYQPPMGFIRGTMFPGLDLPFMGMVNTQEKSKTTLHQLQSLGFALTELGLYLDTHSLDAEAFSLFQDYQEMYQNLMAAYENENGPLMQSQSGMNGSFDWVNDPWPWNYDAQREG